MSRLLDTSIAIHLRDDTGDVGDRIAALDTQLCLSAVSLVELEGGVYAVPVITALRRAKLDVLLSTLDIIDFSEAMARVYGSIVERSGFSRRKIIDRMIAATAIVAGLPIITTNEADFADIPGLELDVWAL